ncbi:HEAT repeat domain-containing protein [Synechococcus elongatus IITB7]|uniref:phycobilisome degradation protein NblB n=1 Tax=Synechococcus elongatus TaxID=32046 RepID=UPI0030CC6E81
MTPAEISALLDSEDYGDRLKALNLIRALERAEAFELICKAIADSNARVRYAAVSQMASLGHQDRDRTRTILIDRLENDSETDVQAAAADALGALQFSDVYPALEAAYQRSSDWVLQFSIVATLGELGDRRAFELLATALESPTDLIRTAAVAALGELGDERAIPLLLPLISDDDWQIRHRLAQALQRFTHPDAQAALAELSQDKAAAVAAAARGEGLESA